MSLQSQFKSKILLEKTEPLSVIKNELEIGMDQDIISADIKDEIDIEYNIIPEDLIKSEPISNNLLESEHLESIETQVFIQTENAPFIKSEFKNLVKTEDSSGGNLSVGNTHKIRKTKKLHELSHEAERDDQYLKYRCDQCGYKTFRLSSFKQHKLIHLKPEEIKWFYCYHCSYKSKRKYPVKDHILRHFKNKEVPFHCYICDFVTKKRDLIIEHFMKHPEHVSKCDETNYEIKLKLTPNIKKRYELTQKSEVEMDDQYLKLQCDKCTYKTDKKSILNRHKLIHLRPKEIQWFYCYHCSYKANLKGNLKGHILGHFKREEVPFHCYICDFVTKKRDLIFEHFKKHSKHISKYELTRKSEVEMDDQYLKYQCVKCTYKTFRKDSFENHKLIHLKPEEIQWFYCYHCSYKAKQKGNLQIHIVRHFKNEVVKFHCYMCNFITLKRQSITEHIKKHSKVQVKSKINQIIK